MFGFVFPREFDVLIRFFVSGVTWSVRVSSGGSRLETRGIAGTAAWRHGKAPSHLQVLNSLLRDVTLWPGLGLLQMVGFKASVQLTGARWRAQFRGLHGLKTEARTRPVPEIVWPDPTRPDPTRAAQLNLEPEPDPKSPAPQRIAN